MSAQTSTDTSERDALAALLNRALVALDVRVAPGRPGIIHDIADQLVAAGVRSDDAGFQLMTIRGVASRRREAS